MSNTEDHEARYEEILRRIESRRQPNAKTPQQMKLASILDGLNALGFLEDMRKKRLSSISIYGPKAMRGHLPEGESTRQWAAALIWYKPRGYHHYRTLNILGIWALDAGDDTHLLVATKTLEFDSPVFNPESYHREIKRGFDLYYRGDAAPPADNHLSNLVYVANQRLALREAIQSILAQWASDVSRT
jgi:hypothetical protein